MPIQKPKRARRKRRDEESITPEAFLEKKHIAGAIVFALFAITTIAICFGGQTPATLQVLPKQIANTRIVANFPFTYESKILTQRNQEQLRKRIAPVYHLDMSVYEKFKKDMILLAEGLTEIEDKGIKQQLSPTEIESEVRDLKTKFSNKTGYFLNAEDLESILVSTDKNVQEQLFEEGLIILREIFREGIYDPSELGAKEGKTSPYFYSIEIEGRHSDSRVLSEEEALRFLPINLSALDIDAKVARAMFRILKSGISSNLIYDAAKSEKKAEDAIAKMQPVTVSISEGQTIIEPGTIVGPEQYETLIAYRDSAKKHEDIGLGFNASLIELSVATLGILFGAVVYLRLNMPKLLKSKRDLTFCAILFLLNLFIIRLILELGETDLFGANSVFLSILPYMAPIALSAILITIMLNARSAIIVSLLVSCFYALMLGNVIRFLLPSILVCLAAIHYSNHIVLRTRVIRAGAIAGLIMAICAAFLGIFNDINVFTILNQMLTAQIAGICTGLIAIFIMPLLQSVFKMTTDITLLELTDFNHPLLRQLQLEAPGTYHHSLMVANLAERAAAEIKANPLVCRVGALFHDIGKVVKPEYFVENQKDGINPHMDRNPSMSALVIKSHVKEGLLMGKESKLPKAVLDIIEQHHGTTLIQYFFDKAQRQKKQTSLPFIAPETIIGEEKIDESTFRYDGPKPQFIECAIVMIADTIEAASRTLKKVSAQSIEELVDQACKEKIEDGQLTECPITLKEIEKLKKSFIVTILNTLHSRIEYPKGKESSRSAYEPKQPIKIPADDTGGDV